MELFDSHCGAITAFMLSLVSDWTVALNTCNTARDSEDAVMREDMADKASTTQTPRWTVKGLHTNLYMMWIDTINLEEVGMDEGFIIYEKMWETSASAHSIDLPQAFRVGLFIKSISRRQ